MAKSNPISIRLSRDVDELVSAEARRTRRSRSAVIEGLTEEAARARLFPGIVFTGPDHDRRASLVGTALDVWQVIELHRDYGSTEALAEDFNALTPEMIRLALAYYERFPEEIDEKIARNNRPAEEWLREYPFIEVFEIPSTG